ncbi:hypothetical protein D3C81_1822580 [compost metagenome]
MSGWVKRALDVLGDHPQLAMLLGAVIALGWGLTGGWLGRRQRLLNSRVTQSASAQNTWPPVI